MRKHVVKNSIADVLRVGPQSPSPSRLTSFVVRTFGQAHGLLSIDNAVQRNAIQWIKRKQSGSGAFPPVCRVLNKEMQGCASGECSLTAYTLLALLDAGATRNVTKETKAIYVRLTIRLI